MDILARQIEALVFCSPKPITIQEIFLCLKELFDSEIPESDIEERLLHLKNRYAHEEFAIELVLSGGGFQFLTKPAYQSGISLLLRQQSRKRLSTSSMETLAIIAYKQPIPKSEIEQIRGVNCDYAVQKLLERGLIEIKGKSDGVGRPLLYGTSEKFMDHFGINTIQELPTLRDLTLDENIRSSE